MRVIVSLTRGLAVLLILAALLFCSFFVNPGMLAWFNRDYAKLAEAYAPERIKLVNKRIEFDSELADRRRDLADINQKLAVTRSKLGTGKDAELQADLDQLLDLKTSAESQVAEQQKSVAATAQDIAEIDRVIERVQSQADDLYLVVRGVALGALGALAQSLVTMMSRRRQSLSRDGNVERAAAAMLVGAIVSVILFAVFHTRQISIFNLPPDSGDMKPDFWRVTVLGLLGGAAASWVYHTVAVSGRRLGQPGALPAAAPPAAPAAPAAINEPPAAPPEATAPVAPPPAMAAATVPAAESPPVAAGSGDPRPAAIPAEKPAAAAAPNPQAIAASSDGPKPVPAAAAPVAKPPAPVALGPQPTAAGKDEPKPPATAVADAASVRWPPIAPAAVPSPAAATTTAPPASFSKLPAW